MFDGLFGKGAKARRARAAEVGGDLDRAARLWLDAERPDEAARVLVVRADLVPDATQRLAAYVHAAGVAPPGSDAGRTARRKRAELLVALAGGGALSALSRHDLAGAARDVEADGDAELAARAYRALGDREGEARALEQAGDVDALESLLGSSAEGDRRAREAERRLGEVDALLAGGARRRALAELDHLARDLGARADLVERAASLRARRALGPRVRVELGGRAHALVLGAEVVLGRAEADLVVPASAVSRRHLAFRRRGDALEVADLGSRNGTTLRGLDVRGALVVGDAPLELRLGREVPVRVERAPEWPGALAVEVAGERALLPLGEARVPGLPFALQTGDAMWLELAVLPGGVAYLEGRALDARIDLLVGDALADRREAPPSLRILST